ncbi:DUF4388 domain-containing protein [Nannocystis sp. ILAH1]|uniref:DUF4388 domain-containing protein n=1 Tax=Nannocystis sp. ILAH1 TaxID=2996789 RepID=UPI0022714A5D|nr:DUF4388 domain-containing protein [Nannocystis sp. ILAH1]MCY0993258.1 DUF4388 domain-containing protein [Nannocystis sp. ILAH1]
MTSADTDLGFPTKGSLKRVPFSSLLRDIGGAGVTGSLYLMSGDTKKVVFFVDGRPTVVRSNLASEFLGQVLTDQGLITQEQCDNTLEAIRRTGKKQGELLVEMGILSEHNLRYGLEEQLRRKLFEIFAWEEGRFQFKEGAEPGLTGTPPAGTTEALILAAIQERFTDERAREALRPYADKYPTQSPKWTGDAAGLELLPEELYFLRCIDGSRTTDELLSRRPDLEVPQLSTLLLGLVSAGVVDALETKSPRRLAPLRPNLTPPTLPEEQLAPGFEVLSTIGEYEDTPLPSRLPVDLGASSSRNPRVPLLPTEDEEMFRGLNVDESIVTDPRNLRAKLQAAASREIIPRPAPAVAPTLTPAPAAADVSGSFDSETDFSDLRDGPEDSVRATVPVPAPAQAPAHKLGPPPGLASLLRKDTPAPVVPPAGGADVSHTSAVIALLDDPELPDDLPDDLPDPDDLLGDESLAGVALSDEPLPDESLAGIALPDEPLPEESLAGIAIPDEPLPEESLVGIAIPDEPLPEESLVGVAIPDEQEAADGDEPLDDIEELEELDDDEMIEDEAADEDEPVEPPVAAAADVDEPRDEADDALADLAGLAGSDPDAEPPPSLAPVSLAPEALTDLPEEPGDLGDLAGDSALQPPAPVTPDAGLAADAGLDPDDLLAGVDDDLLLGDSDEPLPDLDDLDGLDLGDDLGDLAGDLGDDLDGAALDPNVSGDLSLSVDLADLGDPNVSGDLSAEIGNLGEDEDEDEAEAEELDPLDDEPELGDLGGDAGYVDEPMLASGENTFVGPNDEGAGGDGGAEAYAAMRYGEAEVAMREGDYDTAVALFEDAYNTGFDTADLHAHLAFARYRASGGDPEIAQNSLDLLDYAEGINPSLAILHAYRGAIYVGMGAADNARECFERALYLDPYCELALEYRDAE